MSHAPERQEKNCLNCGCTVVGRYCHQCGQENIVPKESFGHLVVHFFYDITHFDGKFFETLKDLIFRPGFLSAEYMKGRRTRYLNPVRMYVFTSAIFFIVFFIVADPGKTFKSSSDIPFTKAERVFVIDSLQKKLEKGGWNAVVITRQLNALKDTTRPLSSDDLDRLDTRKVNIKLSNADYLSDHEYDSAQALLPKEKRDNWFKRMWIHRQISLNQKYRENPKTFFRDFMGHVFHEFPYLLFVSLPVFALILKLLYVRRKNFYYADHAIFTIHYYIFSFILLLTIILMESLRTTLHWGWLGYITMLLSFAWPVYLYIAMYKFYEQRWFKTFMKFILLNLLGLLSLLILFTLFFLFAVIQF